MKILSFLKKLRRDQRGISAIEYAILIGVVGVALVAVLGVGGNALSDYVQTQIDLLTTTTSEAQER